LAIVMNNSLTDDDDINREVRNMFMQCTTFFLFSSYYLYVFVCACVCVSMGL